MSKGRWKKIIGILLMVCVFVGTACLPQITAVIQDKIMNEVSSQKELQTIHLSFQADDTEMSELFLQKLNVLRGGSLYNIYGVDSSEKMEEVKWVLNTELSSYYNADLLRDDWKNAVKSFEPYVSYKNEFGYGIFWEIAFSDYKKGSSLNAYLEDETGKLLFIHYETSQISLEEKERIVWLEKLVMIYDETLKSLPDAGSWIRKDIFWKSKYSTEMNSTFSHEKYGEFQIEFKVNEDGFYIRYV